MMENTLNVAQEILLKKHLREKLLAQAAEERKKRQPRPTYIYDGFRRAWHVLFE